MCYSMIFIEPVNFVVTSHIDIGLTISKPASKIRYVLICFLIIVPRFLTHK